MLTETQSANIKRHNRSFAIVDLIWRRRVQARDYRDDDTHKVCWNVKVHLGMITQEQDMHAKVIDRQISAMSHA